MVQRQQGLIVNISFFAGRRYYGNVAYGTAKAAVDRMTQDMALELKSFNVAAVSLYPGYIAEKKPTPNPKKESPIFVGRAIAGLAADPMVMSKSGTIQVAALLAKEYGFTDIDGTQPDPYDEL
jgi:dehydrogenase/reductase SDR family protein 1